MNDRSKSHESRPGGGDRDRDRDQARGGKSDMTAASGLGPRDRNGGRDDDRNRGNDRDRYNDRDRDRPVGGDRERDRDRDRDVVDTTHRAPRAGGGRSTAAIIGALIAGLLLGGAAVALLNSQDDGNTSSGDPFAGVVDTARYQAVILSNDKVYFGKLSAASDDFYELQQAFFLRETRENAEAEPVRALLPVNREIHAPDNTMLIRKSEVVLVENLAKDSPILTEIKRQLGGGK
jgi:hypothetical protein